MLKIYIKEDTSLSLMDELNSLPICNGKSGTTFDVIKTYEKVLNKLPIGTIIGMDWDAGNCYFKKVSDEYVGWEELISPHYDLNNKDTFDIGSRLASRGNWCKKPLWIATDEEFDKIANKERGTGGSGFSFIR